VRVAAHVFGEAALPGLIAAGLDSIEHGTGLTEDLLDEVARRGIAVVPTLINMRNLPEIAAAGADRFPVWAAHLRSLDTTRDERIRAAWEAGIPLYTGTDAGGSLPHGLIVGEIEAMVQLGIPLPEVIAQASWRGREWLGLPGLAEGAPADLVVYDTDPRADLAAVRAPRRMMLRGAVIA
jgi:imidazolonepropionase-like amidohydrolase